MKKIEFIKKISMFIFSLILFVGYMILTDPFTNSMLDDIPYGIALVFTVKTFLMLFLIATMMHLFIDRSLDKTYGFDESEITKKAMESGEGAGYLMVSRSLRYISVAIVLLGVLYYTK